MPTSARWEVTNSPKIFVKIGTTCRADVGIDPYNEIWQCIRIRRKFSHECSVFRRAEQSPAPTNSVPYSAALCVNQTCFNLKLMTLPLGLKGAVSEAD